MNSNDVKVIMVSGWKEEAGCVPTRIVMWKKIDRHPAEMMVPYVTHCEGKREDGELDFFWGHYDMTLEDARYDFDKRCRDLGVKFSHFNADYQAQ